MTDNPTLKPCPHVEIRFSRGLMVLVDELDFEIVSPYNWKMSKKDRYVRAWCIEKKQMISIHRLLLGFPKGKAIDHINGDSLDNRRANLRVCEQSMNLKNRKRNVQNVSGFKGVSPLPSGSFRVKIDCDKQTFRLGTYESARDAAIAYNAAAKVLHGEFAHLNKIPRNTRAAPKVKALEWSHCDEAKGGGAKYNAYEFGREGLWRVVCYPHEDQQYVVATDVTRSDAKAAAQADFERRILDALE